MASAQVWQSSSPPPSPSQDRDPDAFTARVRKVLFGRVRAKVRVKNEMFNEEKRVKVTLQSAERVRAGSKEHVDRLRAEVEQLKAELGEID